METTNLNIRTDKKLKLNVPNDVTAAAIAEGKALAHDTSKKGYNNMDDLKAALFS